MATSKSPRQARIAAAFDCHMLQLETRADMPQKGVKRGFDAIAASAAQVTWEDLPALSEESKAVLREAGLLPATAVRMVDDLGYTVPGDLEVCICAG